jgi:hypothetical protein
MDSDTVDNLILLSCLAVLLAPLCGGLYFLRRPRDYNQPVSLPPAKIADGRLFPRAEPKDPLRRRNAPLGVALLATFVGLLIFAAWYVVAAIGSMTYTMGRPLRIRNRIARATRVRGGGWSDRAVPRLSGLDDATRAALGEAWHAAAEMEHASIAAFAQMSMQLVALGAPAALVRRTHEAALDEIRHAERCFALAGAYADDAWTAGPLPALARAEHGTDLVRMAVRSLLDGCLGEGLAADVAARGAADATDPLVIATLQGIAIDERAHAELAWSALAWCIEAGGAPVGRAVAERGERMGDELPDLSTLPGVSHHGLAAHGFPDLATVTALARTRAAATAARARAMTEVPLKQAA